MKQGNSRMSLGALFASKGAAQPAIAPMSLMRQAEEQALAPRAAREPAHKDFFRVNMHLDADAHRRFTERAEMNGIGVNETVIVAIDEYLREEASRIGACTCLLKPRASSGRLS